MNQPINVIVGVGQVERVRAALDPLAGSKPKVRGNCPRKGQTRITYPNLNPDQTKAFYAKIHEKDFGVISIALA